MRMTGRRHLTVAAALLVSLTLPGPAQAFFGIGGIVYDPRNHAENLLTAARTLRQIDNQVRQLANEARMLANQARNLARLPDSVAGDFTASLFRVDALIRSAEGLAWQVEAIEAEYRRLFPAAYGESIKTARILSDAREAWEHARLGFRHALAVQAAVMGEVEADTLLLDRLLAGSQGAAGNLQALQAGNQLTALAAKQTMQLQALVAAQARAVAIEGARALAAREQGRARLDRFLGEGGAYTRE